MNYMDAKSTNGYIHNLIIFIIVLGIFVTTTTVLIIVKSVEMKSNIKNYVELCSIIEDEKQHPSVKQPVVESKPQTPVEQPTKVKEQAVELPSRSEHRFSDEDIYLLAKIINAEAGDEPYDGMIAVGNVVLNRLASPEYPKTIRGVIYQKGQFSPVTDGAINKTPNDKSIKAAKEVIKGVRVVGENVMYFYDPSIAKSKWIFKRKVVAKIGGHAFAI